MPTFEESQNFFYDSDELKHNCHSDLDEYADTDPMYEYDKCNKYSNLEKKVESRLHTYEKMCVSTFTEF